MPGSLTAGDTPCEVFFESDNIRAREVIRKLPTETGTRFRTSVMRPRHSSDESAIPETLAAMLALSSHKTLIWTTGAISAMVRQFLGWQAFMSGGMGQIAPPQFCKQTHISALAMRTKTGTDRGASLAPLL